MCEQQTSPIIEADENTQVNGIVVSISSRIYTLGLKMTINLQFNFV